MTELDARGIDVDSGSAPLLRDVSLSLGSGEFVAVLGPNGAGKTTLLRALLGLVPLSGGTVSVDGAPFARLSPAERARRIAYLPQNRPLAWPSPVRDVVALGRFAHGGSPGRLGSEDAEAVAHALAACELGELAHRATDSLSGGELARVHIARAFAARAGILLADEPVAELDPRHQLRILERVRDYVDDGAAALVVLHDIRLAARFADRLVFLSGGRRVADGPPAAVLTPALLADVYGVRARVRAATAGIDIWIDSIL